MSTTILDARLLTAGTSWKRQIPPPKWCIIKVFFCPTHFNVRTFSFLKEICHHFSSVRKAAGLKIRGSFQLLLHKLIPQRPRHARAGYPMACRSSSLWTGMVSFPRKRLMIGRLLANLSLISISKTSVRSAKKEYF